MKLTKREIEIIDGLIEVQRHHAERCERIPNQEIGRRQRARDLERVKLLEKIKKNSKRGYDGDS